MSFFRHLRRHSLRVLAPVALATALLAACGGGTSQVQTFTPARILVLGDESGLLTGGPDGRKYGINDERSTATADAGKCASLPNYAQDVASHFNVGFAECNAKGTLTVKGFMGAKLGARLEDPVKGLAAQIDAQNPAATDLVTVMIGTHDIVALYEQKAAGQITRAAAVAEAQRLGNVYAAQVNRLLARGTRALVFTIPNLGLSPYARNKKDGGDADAVALISTLSAEFNASMRVGIDASRYDGRNYGLVLADDVSQTMERFPTSFLSAPANVSKSACVDSAVDADATACTIVSADLSSDTNPGLNPKLIRGAGATNYLWATDILLGPAAQVQIGAQARSRLINNPF